MHTHKDTCKCVHTPVHVHLSWVPSYPKCCVCMQQLLPAFWIAPWPLCRVRSVSVCLGYTVSPLLALCFLSSVSSLLPPGPRPFLPDTHPCCWTQCWPDQGRIKTPIPIRLSDCPAHLGPCTHASSTLTGLSSHPAPATLKALGTLQSCLQGCSLEATQLQAAGGRTAAEGGSVSSLASWILGSAGETETKADNGLLPSLGSPGWPALGSLLGPLLFPVLSAGLLASLK